MGIIFGLLSAASIGGAELFGRKVTIASDPIRAGLAMQLMASICLGVMALILPGEPLGRDLLLGAISGVSVGLALVLYLQGLMASSSTVVAPVSASLLAALPFAYTIIRGARPSALGLLAPVVALAGIIIISTNGRGDGGGTVRSGLLWGGASGIGFGVGLSLLVEVSSDSGVWSGASQRVAAMLTMVAVLAGKSIGQDTKLPSYPRGLGLSIVLSGTAAGLSSLFYLLGLEINEVHTVVAASAYPAMSVMVGNVVFDDRVSGPQAFGICLVILGIVGVAVF